MQIKDKCDTITPKVVRRSVLKPNVSIQPGTVSKEGLKHTVAKLKVMGGLAKKSSDGGEPGMDAISEPALEGGLPELSKSGGTLNEFEFGHVRQSESLDMEDDLDQLVEPQIVDEWYGDLVRQPEPPSGRF